MRTMPLLIVLVASITGSLLFAAEPAPGNAEAAAKQSAEKATPASKPADADAAAKTADDAEAKPGDKAAEKPDPAKTAADKAASPQRFIPSEQVRADFDVSFPVDI